MHNTNATKILSHPHSKLSLAERISQLKTKIVERGDLDNATVAQQCEILDELSEFNLGKFLILHGGLNGYWTQYICLHPQHGALTQLNDESKPFSNLESWLLNRAPLVLATQQRFAMFRELTQAALVDHMQLASLPCGLMDDILGLDFTRINSFTLTGIDLDSQSLQAAMENAYSYGLANHCHFLHRDAWDLNFSNEFDILSSNGLNFYEPSDDRLELLYRKFNQCLKSHGVLVTSIITHPPSLDSQSHWDMSKIHYPDLLRQKLILGDILDSGFLVYRSEQQTRQQLENAGFKRVTFHYDIARMMPTVVAQK